MALRYPTIPENITVHLGEPDQAAQNITIPFTDYISNVAASEIYPTWPRNALTANIYAIISFTLNRIYNEWYPSKGYNFDITSSPKYDQAYTPNRSTYENIDSIVGEIFNNYVVKGNQIQPYFTKYCDGRLTTCDGLSQWGSVSLANQGKSPLDILKYYYGNDISIKYDAPVGDVIGYPGYPVKLGNVGNPVLAIQRDLRRIRLNYPAILIPIRVMSIGVYGKDTFKGGQESGGEWDISHVKYVASSWEDANNWIEKHKGLTSKELDSVIKNEDFELYEAASVHADFSNKELTVKNIIEWFEKNHPKYVNRLRKEFNLPLDSILSDQLTKQDLYNLIRELRLEKSLCNDFGISESEYYSKYVDMKESFNKLTEEDERDLYLKAGLDPDIDRTPGTRDDGTYYDDRGFHYNKDNQLISEVTKDGHVVMPIEDLEWWTY